MITKKWGDFDKIQVIFSLPATIWADTIHLVGDFNNWNKKNTPLQLGEDNWSVSLELKTGNIYRYHYLIDGTEWNNDWHSDGYVTGINGRSFSIIDTRIPLDTLLQGHLVEKPVLLPADPPVVYGSVLQSVSQRPSIGAIISDEKMERTEAA